MDETGGSKFEDREYRFEPTQLENQLLNNETGGLINLEGSPRIWYVDIEGDVDGIFKPSEYSDVQNERAAYLVSHIVGFDIVPTTVLRNIGGQEGSLQEFVEGVFLDEVDEADETIREGLYKEWIFGHAIRNMDRGDWNLVVLDGKVFSVDHDSSFDPDFSDPANFDFYRQYYGMDAPISLVETFRSYLGDESRKEVLKETLSGIISSEDVDITLRRLDHIGNLLVQNGKIENQEELKI